MTNKERLKEVHKELRNKEMSSLHMKYNINSTYGTQSPHNSVSASLFESYTESRKHIRGLNKERLALEESIILEDKLDEMEL